MMSRHSRTLPAIIVATLSLSCICIAQSGKTVLENNRVRIKTIDVAKGESLPEDNRYDVITLRLADGETAVTEPGLLEKPDKPHSGASHFLVAGTRRSVKNISKNTLPFMQIQFLQPQGKYVAFEVPPSHYCNSENQKACVTERYLFCTDRFCAENVTLDPGAASTQHTHDADYIVIGTSDFTWRNEPVGKPATEEHFKVGEVRYVEAGGSHRLVNTGGTTAQLFVIQFK